MGVPFVFVVKVSVGITVGDTNKVTVRITISYGAMEKLVVVLSGGVGSTTVILRLVDFDLDGCYFRVY